MKCVVLKVSFAKNLSPKEANSLAHALADHILETFNDNESLTQVQWKISADAFSKGVTA